MFCEIGLIEIINFENETREKRKKLLGDQT